MKNQPLFVQILGLPLEHLQLVSKVNNICKSIQNSRYTSLQSETTDVDEYYENSVFIYDKPEHLKVVNPILESIDNYTQHDFIAIPIKSKHSPTLTHTISEAIRENAFMSTTVYDRENEQYLACLYYPDEYNLDEIENKILEAIK